MEPWDMSSKLRDAAARENAIIPVSASRETGRWTRRRLVGLSLALLLVGTVAAALYISNQRSGTVTVQDAIILAGGWPASMFRGTSVDAAFTYQSNVATSVTATLQVTWSKPGIVASDVSMNILGNPTTPTCAADVCTYVSGPFTIAANAPVTSLNPVSATINTNGDYSWTAVINAD